MVGERSHHSANPVPRNPQVAFLVASRFSVAFVSRTDKRGSTVLWFAVKFQVISPGPNNFVRAFGWAYKRGAYIPGELISGIKKSFLNELIRNK